MNMKKNFHAVVAAIIASLCVAAGPASAERAGYEIVNFPTNPSTGDVSLLGYDKDTGKAHVYYFRDPDRQAEEFSWRKIWTHIISRDSWGAGFFYSSSNGEAAIYFRPGDDRNRYFSGLHRGFDIVTRTSPGKYLFYDRDTGEFAFYNPQGNELGAPKRTGTSWSPGWDIITPVGNYLLLYDRENGRGKFSNFKGGYYGTTTFTTNGWRKSWHSIVPYKASTCGADCAGIPGYSIVSNFTDDEQMILFYDQKKGEANVYEFDTKNGKLGDRVQTFTGWRKTWDVVKARRVDGKTRIYFYDKETGDYNVYEVKNNGKIGKRVLP